MGCCVSSGTADRTNENVSNKHTNIVEEETVVKEVLSETTFHSSSSNVQNSAMDDPMNRKIQGTEEEKFKVDPDLCMNRPVSIDPEEGSEVSEICSLSLSESVSSVTVMNGYGEEEVKQRKSQRSPVKTRTRVTGNNYPTRRTDQSSRKRINGACNTGARVGSGMIDPGERSGRRSRSPATNRSVMDSSQTRVGGARTRKNSQSPGRLRVDPNTNTSDQQQHQNYGYTTEELLENPLVSLECFIFL
ncbi:PREDICTED: uncharacterized protein LOC106339664 [Brassica oleracea var. oleracea]|uniref:Uncharacterized protein n=1 Tax=Brassica oleracea var. oleracea TaxID=109376 RepID=A0A0D3BVC9_BRAOL|nr:PREDICTED: uncharacterized protein LOC106339664 [Brassica oleracea var. oleracea]